MKKTLVILIFGFLTLSSVSAQKFGYVNSQELLASMPDVKNADNQLKSFQDPLIKKGQDMVDALEAEYGKYMEDVNNGLLSNVKRQQKEQDIQSKQVNIQNYQAEVQEKILKKREELYQPILDKVNNTIKKYGVLILVFLSLAIILQTVELFRWLQSFHLRLVLIVVISLENA